MTKTISFSFNVLNGNEIIAQETLNYKVNESQLRDVAAVMDGNGGHLVDLCALEGLTTALEEEIYVHRLPEILPEDTDYDGIFVQLQEDMPEELVAAADEYVRLKEVLLRTTFRKMALKSKGRCCLGFLPRSIMPCARQLSRKKNVIRTLV